MDLNTLTPLVYIVDDEFAIRDSLEMFLTSHGVRVEAFESGEAFFKAFNPLNVSCLLLDVFMANMTGHEVQERLNELGSTMPIIFMSGHAGFDLSVKAFKSGALDFLEKPFNLDLVLERVSEAFTADVRAKVRRTKRAKVVAQLETLTSREQEVLKLLLSGNSNKAVSKGLKISVRTVEVHRANLLEKLGSKNLSTLLTKVLPVVNAQQEQEASDLYATFLENLLMDDTQ